MRGRGVAAAVVVLLLVGAAVAGVTLSRSGDDSGSGRRTGPDILGPSSTPTRTPSLAGWRPLFADDFDTIDPSRWEVLNETAHSNEQSNLFASNVTTSNGVLRIQARQQETTTRAGGTREYTSGYLITTGQVALPPYFRLEVRAKVPFSQGMWAAPGWLRPVDRSGGEIDAVETYGSDRSEARAVQTIHAAYGDGHQQSAHSIDFAQVGDPTGTGWHTYIVQKTEGRIQMWVDGVNSATWSSGDPSWFDTYYEAGKSWDLRLNLQVGSGTGGRPDNQPDDTTDWSDPDATALLIDYVKVWEPDS